VSGFRVAAEQYVALRRAVGFKLRRAEGSLFNFVEFLEAEQATCITIDLALRWAMLPAGASPGWWNSRLCLTRGFARHMSAIDPATEVHRSACSCGLALAAAGPSRTCTHRPRSLP
jgi:integrase/recombinase XerD